MGRFTELATLYTDQNGLNLISILKDIPVKRKQNLAKIKPNTAIVLESSAVSQVTVKLFLTQVSNRNEDVTPGKPTRLQKKPYLILKLAFRHLISIIH